MPRWLVTNVQDHPLARSGATPCPRASGPEHVSERRQYDAIVIGAGAAGLMCAIAAGQRGARVLVVDHANKVGKKILMSGGGRCNFTNTGTTPANYLSANPHFCKSALARYTPWHFIELVERHGIAYHEKELGQLFCDESSKLIVKLLLDECAAAGVEVRTHCTIERVEHADDGRFRLHTTQGHHAASSLVVASGGLSIPSMGASGFGYALAKQFGHEVLPTRAGLVPLTLTGKHAEHLQDLAGVALPVEARCNGASFRNFMLVTHRGISGPAILQVSSCWQPGDDLRLDLLPGIDAEARLREWQATAPRCGAEDPARRDPAEAVCPAPVRTLDHQQAAAPVHPARIGRHRQAAVVLAAGCQRHRGLPHRGSDPRRGRHRWPVFGHHDVAPRARPVFHRRSRRCHRLAGRLQLPVGLGQRPRRGYCARGLKTA